MRTPRGGRAGFAAVLLMLSGCASTRIAVPAADFAAEPPPVAAQFRSQLRAGPGPARIAQWHYWRSADVIVHESPAQQTGRRLQRDGNSIFRTDLYHADRRAITFEPADLQMLGAPLQWRRESLLIDPELLAKLRPAGNGWRKGHPWRRYQGVVDGVHWDVVLRMDVMLPELIVRQESGQTERIELLQAAAPAEAAWQPRATQDYATLDFADLGDHERDPFVARIQARMGTVHSH